MINNKKIKKVMCIETSVVYENSMVAKKELGISHILECCKKQRETAGGLHWQYAKEDDVE